MRKLIGEMFKWPVVWTQDHDGELRLRFVRRIPHVYGLHVFGIGGLVRGRLEADGSITGGLYMLHWKPANKYAERMFGKKAGRA